MKNIRFPFLPIALGILVLVVLVGSHAQLAHAAPPSATSIPVVFIPGISGSRLADSNNVEYWTAAGYGHSGLTLYPNQSHPTLFPTNAITEATFLGFHVPSDDWQTYGPIINYFQSQGLVLYDTHQDPYYQTSAGCDLTQASNHPNLFVFAYDWRQSNANSASALADYVACVEKFYPGTQINLVAHSMGGLVARRYIIAYPNNNHVNALISVASPFLGAPKLVWVEETGKFIFFVWASTLLNMLGSFNGASEVMASQAWYNLGGAPELVEDGQDLNHDGNDHEQFTYPMLIQYMDASKGQQGFLPGTANQQFHTYSNNGNATDNWSNDTTGVKYFHIYGSGTQPDTVSQTVATTFWKCIKNYSICDLSTWMYPNFSLGDQTVALLAATRMSSSGNYNAPGATLYDCQAQGANSRNVDHVGLLSNPVVQGLLIQYLAQANGATPQPPPPSSDCGAGSTNPTVIQAAQAHANYHRLTLSGVSNVQVSDNNSHTFTDGASVIPVNSDTSVVLLASGKTYNITFKSTKSPLYAEWLLLNKNNKPAQAERFIDQEVKPNLNMRIHIEDGQVASLRYDGDKNGSFETKINPTINVKGAKARDVTPPDISFTQSPAPQGKRLIKLVAKDTDGITRLVYTLDGTHFQKYNGAFQVDRSVKTVSAFADDGVGNRSKLTTFNLK